MHARADLVELERRQLHEQLGIPVSPTRRKCALLSLKVMRGATGRDASWPVAAERTA